MSKIRFSPPAPASQPLPQIALFSLLAGGLLLTSIAQAATITVNSASDLLSPGTGCTLRGAVSAINDGSNINGCTATGSYGSSDTILFALPDNTTIAFASRIEISKNLTIDGNNKITLDGNQITRLLEISGGTATSVANLAFKNGGVPICYIYDIGSCFSGAIYNPVDNHTLTVRNSVFKDNSTSFLGGAIYTRGNLEVTGSTFSGNHALWGGALSAGHNVTITNSTFNENLASYGGAIYYGGIIDFGSSTNGALKVTDSTFVNNYGEGAAIYLTSTNGSVKNSLIAGDTNVSTAQCATAGNAIFNSGTNIEWRSGSNENTCNSTSPVLVPAGMSLTQIVSSTLADNGGPTPTLALPAGSPAIDSADAAVADTTDQRGQPRPQGNGPDLGAFEATPHSPDPYTHANVTTRIENGVTLTTINGQLIPYPEHFGKNTAVFVFANIAGTNDWLLLNPGTGWHLWADCNSTAFPYTAGSMPWVTDIAVFYNADLSTLRGSPIFFGYGVGDDNATACTDMFNNTRFAHVATL